MKCVPPMDASCSCCWSSGLLSRGGNADGVFGSGLLARGFPHRQHLEAPSAYELVRRRVVADLPDLAVRRMRWTVPGGPALHAFAFEAGERRPHRGSRSRSRRNESKSHWPPVRPVTRLTSQPVAQPASTPKTKPISFSCRRVGGIRRRPVGRRRRGRRGGGSLGAGGGNVRPAPRGLIRSRRTTPPSNGFRECRAPGDGLRRCSRELGLDGRFPFLDRRQQPAQEG